MKYLKSLTAETLLFAGFCAFIIVFASLDAGHYQPKSVTQLSDLRAGWGR